MPHTDSQIDQMEPNLKGSQQALSKLAAVTFEKPAGTMPGMCDKSSWGTARGMQSTDMCALEVMLT